MANGSKMLPHIFMVIYISERHFILASKSSISTGGSYVFNHHVIDDVQVLGIFATYDNGYVLQLKYRQMSCLNL